MATKTGGRKAGTPNKKTVELLARLSEMDWDPLQELHELAKEARAAGDLANAIKANASMLNFIFPKRKSIDVTSTGGPAQLIINTGVPTDPTPDDSSLLLERLSKALK